MKYKAVMLDFDGTVTELGVAIPSEEMLEVIIEVSEQMPLAFCSGRQFESFAQHGLLQLNEYAAKTGRQVKLENIFLIGENGSTGHYYDATSGNFTKFYEASWPEDFIGRERLRVMLAEEVREFGVVMDSHEHILVVRPQHDFGTSMEIITPAARKIYQHVSALLKQFDATYDQHLFVGNSGIGVVICPVSSNKDVGIRQFAELLNELRGWNLKTPFREILVIGDQPNYYGNDHAFLSGRYGTPYSVGMTDESAGNAVSQVRDDDGRVMLHDAGTIYLLQKVLRGESL